MAEMRKKVEPTVEELNNKMDMLSEKLNYYADMAQNYTKENPMQALGFAMLGGVAVGLIIGATVAKKH